MKQSEIKPCVFCGKGVMANQQIACTRVRFTRYVVDLNAVRRAAGLEMMIGPLAQHMGPDEDLMKPVGPEADALVCDACSFERRIFDLHECGSTK